MCEVGQVSNETSLLHPVIKELGLTLQTLMERPTKNAYLSTTEIVNEETLMITCISSYETPIECKGEFDKFRGSYWIR